MNGKLLIAALIVAALLLALGGWAVDGLRWLGRGGRRRQRLALA